MQLDNQIISYLDGKELKLGWVSKGGESKLRVQAQGGRDERVTPRQVLCSHGPAAIADLPRRFNELTAQLAARAAEVDPELLWESVTGEEREFSAAQLATAYFSKDGPLEQAALVKALLADTQRFRHNGLLFTVRSATEIAQVQERKRKEAERVARQERLTNWGKAQLANGSRDTTPEAVAAVPDGTPEVAEFLSQLEAYLFSGHQTEAARLLVNLRAQGTPRESGVELLRLCGRLPEDADPFLLANGIIDAFPESVNLAAAAATPFAAQGGRTDYSAEAAFSIDDACTREVDDAITVATVGDRLVVGVHIADPAVFVHRDDPVDREAFERTLTLYLPTTVVTMLPPRLGCDLASLNQGQLRPAISFRAVFTASGELESWTLERGQIRVARRLTYEEAEALLAAGTDPLGVALTALAGVTTGLRAARVANGAIELKRQEVDVHVRHGVITVQVVVSDSPARRIVSELMILVNRLAAEYALAHDVPVIYRNQEPPSSPVPQMTEYDPVLFERALRGLRRTRLSTHPQRHAGLGLDIYMQISSPIRRFADLALQRQLAAALAGEPMPYSALEIIEVLGAVEATEQRHRQLERDAKRRWLLEYVRRQPPDTAYEAAVMADSGLVELLRLGVRARLTGCTRLDPGTRLAVRCRDVRSDFGELLVEPECAPP